MHPWLFVLLALLVAGGQLRGRLRLLDNHHAQTRARQPLRIRMIVHLWKTRVWLIALQTSKRMSSPAARMAAAVARRRGSHQR